MTAHSSDAISSPTGNCQRRGQEKQVLAAVALMLLWCIALLSFRIYLNPNGIEIALMWNLFLASLPLAWGAGFQSASHRKRPVAALLFFGLWILFLPNAPYILTDLVHFGPKPGVPTWFILAMLLSCAGTGTMLGYLSLIGVQRAVQDAFGKVAGWVVASGSLMLCGFGIYIGRFLRWNSWDALTRPLDLAKSVLSQFTDPGPFPHPTGVTLVYGLGLIVGYLVLHAIGAVMREEGVPAS
jgi:uncharacterized membrane protein